MITIDKIDSQFKWDALGKFAATFDHVIDDHSMTPVYTMSRDGRQFGYFNIIMKPVIVPAFHTNKKICTPRDFLEGISVVKKKVMRSTRDERFPNGTLLVLLPKDLDKKYSGAIKRLKLKKLDSVMYQAND